MAVFCLPEDVLADHRRSRAKSCRYTSRVHRTRVFYAQLRGNRYFTAGTAGSHCDRGDLDEIASLLAWKRLSESVGRAGLWRFKGRDRIRGHGLQVAGLVLPNPAALGASEGHFSDTLRSVRRNGILRH